MWNWLINFFFSGLAIGAGISIFVAMWCILLTGRSADNEGKEEEKEEKEDGMQTHNDKY